ncbi:MAG: HEAT repeat domain-containing protein [Armatimonadota bacterium]|nr:HEAT repeat domain-containing protein [Armatimonadota bacterium]
MKNKNAALITAIVTALALFALLFGIYHYIQSNSIVSRGARRYSSNGVMSAENYRRLASIQTNIFRTGTITDADLRWAISLLHSRPLVESQNNENGLHRAVLLYLTGIRYLTPSQQSEFFTAVVPLASDKDRYVRQMAATTLGEIGDARAKPYLKKMQSDPVMQVRVHAAQALKRLAE